MFKKYVRVSYVNFTMKKIKKRKPYLLNNFTLVVASSKTIKMNDVPNIGDHVLNKFQSNICLNKGMSDLIDALSENLLIDDSCIAHTLESTSYAAPKFC